jgi:hypothetical protein
MGSGRNATTTTKGRNERFSRAKGDTLVCFVLRAKLLGALNFTPACMRIVHFVKVEGIIVEA